MLVSQAKAIGIRSLSKNVPLLSNTNRIFTNLNGGIGSSALNSSISRGDWSKTAEILTCGSDWIIEEVTKSEIRGRGGAGFLTGKKWKFLPKDSTKPHYLVINADEGEPGTCKDRQIMTNEPQKLIEGAFLSSVALRVHKCYIYIRGEFRHEQMVLNNAIKEASDAGLIGDHNMFNYPFQIVVHSGAGAYVCGEETALLNSIMGKAGRPRTKPPFPAVSGLYNSPTIVNNVETISSVGTICRRGGAWFSSLGIPNSKGTKIYSISGCVNNPCVVEDTMGASMKELIETHAGGVCGGWDNLLGVIPGGLSCQIIPKEQCETAVMGYDELAALGSSFGTAAMIILDKNTCIPQAMKRISQFYAHESCGQCGPCRNGTQIIDGYVQKIIDKKASKKDIDEMTSVCETTRNCICALAESASNPQLALLRKFQKQIIGDLL